MNLQDLIQKLENVYPKNNISELQLQALSEELRLLSLNDLDSDQIVKNFIKTRKYQSFPSVHEIIEACKDYAEKKGEGSYLPTRRNQIKYQDFKCPKDTWVSWFAPIEISNKTDEHVEITPPPVKSFYSDSNTGYGKIDTRQNAGKPNRFFGQQLVRDERLLNFLMNGLGNQTKLITLNFKNDLVADDPEYQSETWKVSKERWGWDSRRINN